MDLWVDDVRVPPDGTWTWAKSYEEAVFILANNVVEAASFDHDLGFTDQEIKEIAFYDDEAATGYDLVKWCERYNRWPTEMLFVHTNNPAGQANMCRVIEDSSPYNNKQWFTAPSCNTRGWVYSV